MDDDLNSLKSELRSVVVSSPTQVDVRSLNNDYRKLMGRDIPYFKYGYRDLVAFLRERCSDCFVLTGPHMNPSLTLIVPDSLKHIDKFVQKQRSTSINKFKGKRRSIPEAVTKSTPPPTYHAPSNPSNLIVSTFRNKLSHIEEPKQTITKPPNIENQNKENLHNGSLDNNGEPVSRNAVKSFPKKRLPLYCSTPSLDDDSMPEKDGISSKEDSSGKQPSSSSSSTKRLQLEILKSEIMDIISDAPTGVWCTDLIRLYRERYDRELNFTRLGYTSLISLVLALEARVRVTRPDHTGDWLLADAARPPAPPARPAPAARPAAAARPARPPCDPDDALPGVDFDPDVFPADCVEFAESVPAAPLDDFRPGASIKVIVGEVYSPSHFWLIRYGEGHSIAMEDMMDEMTEYYARGEGRARWLACGAVRVGHYCSSVFERDWHRSLIVKIIDSDTVKVRHIDYGTVETVPAATLKPLRRAWAALPAQAVRARLAAARPAAAGRRWPRAAAHHFLQLVRERRLFASVVARDDSEAAVEVLLIDTSRAMDASVTELMIRAGHADERREPPAGEPYLFPRFDALESGATPSYAEIHAYLRDGIALDYVDAYRRHVPVDLPPPTPDDDSEPEPRSKHEHESESEPEPHSEHEYESESEPEPEPHSEHESGSDYECSLEAERAPSPPPAPPAATRIPLLWPGAAGSAAPPQPAARYPSLAALAPARPPPPPPPPYLRAPFPVFTGAPLPLPMPPPPLPPPPFGAAAAGAVTLSVAECEVYRVLCGVDPPAAQWYMSCALGRALAWRGAAGAGRAGPAPLNAGAPEFRMRPPAALRPPPGF